MAAETLSLAGKTALVTGSGRETGIGAAIARAFARNGAAVAIHYVSENSKARAEKVAADISREFGTKTTVVRGALDKVSTATKIVKETLKELDVTHIDILGAYLRNPEIVLNEAWTWLILGCDPVNNAGYGSTTNLTEATPELLEQEFGINVFATIYLIQAVIGIGKMPRGGRILNVGSIASKLGLELSAVYAAAKAAQDSLTASWAGQLGRSHGITVNTLAPGPMLTDMSKGFLVAPDGSASELQTGLLAQTRAEARIGTVNDMADVALLLVSEKSRWLTAQWISVSGGVTGTM
ncbi:short-chain dehydrogenase [Trichoderma arundinaceum]|uniref:Short-chain dehydrogenase n=1 Tax=Trichoderma arundinaceum TaxID=490622 RepID=A0A395NNT4_TRIAR|nr:short-chain dehydrogenase [Trichoderma arundinaceum]